ncbi:MAG: hypothetical protein ACOCQN_00590 [Halanaerobiaceae bacterium]
MYLRYRYSRNKIKPDRIYLYIRRRAYKNNYLGPEIPLGRVDRGDPEKKVKEWLESSDNLPEQLKGLVTLDDVCELYLAVISGKHWNRIERFQPGYGRKNW